MKRNTKKLFALLLVSLMALQLCACAPKTVTYTGDIPEGVVTVDDETVLVSWYIDGEGNGTYTSADGKTIIKFEGVTVGSNNGQEGHGKLDKEVVSSVLNTRDIGGYVTTDGKTISSNRLIRSGKLQKLNDEEAANMVEYGLNRIIDLRNEGEISSSPDYDFVGNGYDVHIEEVVLLAGATTGISAEKPPVEVADVTGDGKVDDMEMCYYYVKMMEYNYNKMVEAGYADGSDHPIVYINALSFPKFVNGENENAVNGFPVIFQQLLENEEGATLWHCTAGKDRVGTTTALLMLALGVDRETIINDWLYTNECIEKENAGMRSYLPRYKLVNEILCTTGEDGEMKAELIPITADDEGAVLDEETGTYYRPFTQEDIDTIISLNTVWKEYPETVLKTMDSKYGCFANFWTEGLGMDMAQLDTLRAMYLE